MTAAKQQRNRIKNFCAKTNGHATAFCSGYPWAFAESCCKLRGGYGVRGRPSSYAMASPSCGLTGLRLRWRGRRLRSHNAIGPVTNGAALTTKSYCGGAASYGHDFAFNCAENQQYGYYSYTTTTNVRRQVVTSIG